MGRTCAWCGALLRVMQGPAITTTSHGLCQGCLEDLSTALSDNGLKERREPENRRR